MLVVGGVIYFMTWVGLMPQHLGAALLQPRLPGVTVQLVHWVYALPGAAPHAMLAGLATGLVVVAARLVGIVLGWVMTLLGWVLMALIALAALLVVAGLLASAIP